MSSPIPKYIDSTDKEQYFTIKKIETLKELQSLIDELQGQELIYRGMHDSMYKIFSSYHRYLHSKKGNESYVDGEVSLMKSKIIGEQIDKIVTSCSFRKNYLQIADDYAKANNGRYRLDTGHFRYYFHSLSKMQHYNAHTYLVDFTYALYVGLLFAVLNHRKASYVSLITFPKNLLTPLDLSDSPADVETYTERSFLVRDIKDPGLLKSKLYDVGLHLLLSPRILLVKAEEKYVRNKRQRNQHGCFLLYDPISSKGIIDDGLESRISDSYYNPRNTSSQKFTSYEISSALIPDIKKILKAKKITPFRLGFNWHLIKCW